MYLSVSDLTRDQIVELKQNYLEKLSQEGLLNEVLYDDAEADNESDGVSYDELANADDLVSDDVIFREYDGVLFTEDDFSSAA